MDTIAPPSLNPPKVQTVSQPSSPMTEAHDQPVVKNANRVLRWNLLWFFLGCVLLVPLPLWLYPVHCLTGFVVICAVTIWICFVLLLCTIHVIYTLARLYRAKQKIYAMELPKTHVSFFSISKFSWRSETFSWLPKISDLIFFSA